MNNPRVRLDKDFFCRDVLEVAPALLGCRLVRRFNDGRMFCDEITEVEAYRGEEDLACHAHVGKTPRTQVMYLPGGVIYVYLIYGMYWMLNLVTGKENVPQALLIRGTNSVSGPGKLGRKLELNREWNGVDITKESCLWIEKSHKSRRRTIESTPRIGVEYAGKSAKKKWRFVLSVNE